MRPSTSKTLGVLFVLIVGATVLLWGAPSFAGTPTLGPDCGTGAALVGTSSDSAGKITLGVDAAQTCTLTFGTPYTNAPACSATNETGATSLSAGTTPSEATITTTFPWVGGNVISYMCLSY